MQSSMTTRREKTMAKCGCGRSETGECVGLHKLTNEEWLKRLNEQKEKKLLTENDATVAQG